MGGSGYSLQSAVVEVTNRCNLRCPHCASDSGVARDGEMSLAELDLLIHDLRLLGCGEFTMLGGEFVLRKDWEQIANAVRRSGMELQFVTNGLLVTPDVRRSMRSLDPQTVGVSIDGASSGSYRALRGVDGFATCRRLLDELVADGFREVHAITTFNARNVGEFDSFAELFVDTPIVWQIQMAHRGGSRFEDDLLMTREHYRTLVRKVVDCQTQYGERLRILPMDDFGYFPMASRLDYLAKRWHGCPAGRHTVGIRSNGDVLPCLSLGAGYVVGNVRKTPLRQLWQDDAAFAEFRWKSCILTGPCEKCPHSLRCRAGCSAMALSQTGKLTETTFCIRQLEREKIAEAML